MSTLSTFSDIWRSFHIFPQTGVPVHSTCRASRLHGPVFSSALRPTKYQGCRLRRQNSSKSSAYIYIFFSFFQHAILTSSYTPWTPNMMLSNLKPLLSKMIYCMAAVYMQPCVSICHILVLALRHSAQETVSLHASICLHLGEKGCRRYCVCKVSLSPQCITLFSEAKCFKNVDNMITYSVLKYILLPGGRAGSCHSRDVSYC